MILLLDVSQLFILIKNKRNIFKDIEICSFVSGIWAASCQNQLNDMCAQRRLRSALASAQSDQSSLCAQWVAKDPNFLHADSEGSDQTGRMPRLIWIFAGRTCHFVGFVMRRLIYIPRIMLFWESLLIAGHYSFRLQKFLVLLFFAFGINNLSFRQSNKWLFDTQIIFKLYLAMFIKSRPNPIKRYMARTTPSFRLVKGSRESTMCKICHYKRRIPVRYNMKKYYMTMILKVHADSARMFIARFWANGNNYRIMALQRPACTQPNKTVSLIWWYDVYSYNI